MDKLRSVVLGATGLVGQMFVKILSEHPMFEVVGVAASERSVGKRYCEAVNWIVSETPPREVCELQVRRPEPGEFKDEHVDVVFSALPSEVAAQVEAEFARDGYTVVSNASPMRLDPDVPLLVPEINWEHVKLAERQGARRGWRGRIFKNPNCSSAILVLSLKPLVDKFGVEKVFITTMQAVSGAGFKGVPSMAIIDNIIPYIAKEEDKLAREPRKILGVYRDGEVVEAKIRIYATTTRVPVLHGHLESVYVFLERDADVDDVIEAWRDWTSPFPEAWLSPRHPVIYNPSVDRPQPRLDRWAGGGMAVVTGRVRRLEERIVAYLVLGHNLVRGAAGNAVLIAELLAREGLL